MGGGKTWGEVAYQDADGQQYYASQNWLAPEYLQLLLSGNVELIQGALTALAEERGRDLPIAEDCAKRYYQNGTIHSSSPSPHVVPFVEKKAAQSMTENP